MAKNQHRGVVLALHDAAAIHRWMELLMDDRRFFNPIEAMEAKAAAIEAKARLGEKLIRQFQGDAVITTFRSSPTAASAELRGERTTDHD